LHVSFTSTNLQYSIIILLSQIKEEATHNTLAADFTLAVVVSPSTSANPGYCILVEDRDGLGRGERGQRERRRRREL